VSPDSSLEVSFTHAVSGGLCHLACHSQTRRQVALQLRVVLTPPVRYRQLDA
jgi:hypothetical protein